MAGTQTCPVLNVEAVTSAVQGRVVDGADTPTGSVTAVGRRTNGASGDGDNRRRLDWVIVAGEGEGHDVCICV